MFTQIVTDDNDMTGYIQPVKAAADNDQLNDAYLGLQLLKADHLLWQQAMQSKQVEPQQEPIQPLSASSKCKS